MKKKHVAEGVEIFVKSFHSRFGENVYVMHNFLTFIEGKKFTFWAPDIWKLVLVIYRETVVLHPEQFVEILDIKQTLSILANKAWDLTKLSLCRVVFSNKSRKSMLLTETLHLHNASSA